LDPFAEEMTTMRSTLRLLSVAVGLALLAAAARADDESAVRINKRGTDEKKFAAELGKAIVKAAHGTSKDQTLVKHETVKPKEGRTDLKVTMEYAGALSGAVSSKKYTAHIDVKIDSSNKDNWEVLNIDYKDDNKVPYSAKKVQELIKKLNEK
jgi:hypothetical protein